MRNYEALLARIARWLRAGGPPVRAHLHAPRVRLPYEDRGPGDWMARHFFTGGQMPSDDLLLDFQRDLAGRRALAGERHALRAHQRSTGWRTWTRTQAARRPGARRAPTARIEVTRWRTRWRVFFMACAELFALSRRRGVDGVALPVRAGAVRPRRRIGRLSRLAPGRRGMGDARPTRRSASRTAAMPTYHRARA